MEEKAPMSGQYMVEYNKDKLLIDTSSKIYKKKYAEYFTSLVKKRENFCNKFSCKIINFSSDMSYIGDLKIKTAFDAQNCSDLLSSIAACFLDKFLGKYIDDFVNNATEKINEMGNDMNNFISEQLEDVNVLADYTNREAFLLKKASLQIKGLTPENLLSL